MVLLDFGLWMGLQEFQNGLVFLVEEVGVVEKVGLAEEGGFVVS